MTIMIRVVLIDCVRSAPTNNYYLSKICFLTQSNTKIGDNDFRQEMTGIKIASSEMTAFFQNACDQHEILVKTD